MEWHSDKSIVVSAKAGTHNPRPWFLQKGR
jgi:hypothetical protein